MNNMTTMNTDPSLMRVFVLEDERFFQEAIKKAVSMAIPDVQIEVAASVVEAKSWLDQTELPYQLAVIDLRLPDGNGVEVIRQIDQKFPGTSILVLSVSGDETRVLEAVRAGATGYLVKGDVMLSLKAAIEQMLCGGYPISPTLAGYFLRLAGREKPTDGTLDVSTLTARELELLQLFADGMSYNEAAETMQISITTVRTHTTNLYRKLGVRSNIKALSVAKQHGLL